jgi:hypothetical protein
MVVYRILNTSAEKDQGSLHIGDKFPDQTLYSGRHALRYGMTVYPEGFGTIGESG